MILMNDFKAESDELKSSMLNAAQRVLESGWYVLGKEVDTFEKEWAHICGVSDAIGVANGMDAIEISLRALNIGSGDEVITTPMTAFATVLAIIRAGAIPVMADIDPETALLSINSVARCISPKTKAVLLVHLYGQIKQMDNWVTFCDKHKIILIEDCAQAHLAKWNGKAAGSFGSAGAYSFYPTKNLGAIGDAGILISNDMNIAERAKCIRNYGQSVRYQHPVIGMNSRLDELQAAILTERLKHLANFTNRRKYIAKMYKTNISNPNVKLMAEPQDVESHVYHLFVILCDEREALQQHLLENNVQSLIHYPIPVHQQDPCLQLSRDPEGLIASEEHASKCLSLPCHPQMNDDDIKCVVNAINSFRCD
jgi:dTDP-4-amino-4,6-dideoxygalactose transaminase